MTNDYYVYIYYRLDTNEPFYVGMGHGNRWKRTDKTARGHNKHFMNIVNKCLVAVEIVKDNLTEEEAKGIECWLINELVFEYGFSINICNNRSIEKGCHLVNMTWGGEGNCGFKWSEEDKKRMSEQRKGEKHCWYGRKHTEETKRKISEAHKGKVLSDETKGKIREANKERLKDKRNHPFYGTHFSEETKKRMSKARIEKGVAKGKNNPKARAVICITTKRFFLTIKEASEFYNCNRVVISACCKGKRKSSGKLSDGTKLVWRYLTWKHNKKYRIINYWR